ncbi:MAG: hypothetical protein A2Y38_01740 [Spirochaetes bacterium GWB1_59_5]|nr:MAG: hypothetical protein A2Y38_01740 [Spirochaetes bacterium GWB1_59_5]
MVAGRVTRDNLAEIGLTLESAPALREARIPGLTRYRVTWTARTRQGTFAGSGEVEAATPQEAIQRMQREIPEARGGTGYRAVPAEPMEGFGAEQRPVPGGGGWGPLETQMNRAGQATGVASMKATPEHVLRVDLVTEGGRQVTAAGEVVPAREMFRWAVNAPPAKGGALLAYGETTTLSEAQTLADAATRIRK